MQKDYPYCYGNTILQDLNTPKRSPTTYVIFSNDATRTRCNKRRLTASDCQEGNRRDCSMSGNQTSGKEGGVQCVIIIVCI